MDNVIVQQKHYLSIELGRELFAINVDKVLEVLEMQQITNVPNMPRLVAGIINFRGDILPVLEARLKLNMKERSSSEKFVIVVLDLNADNRNLRIGLVADRVTDVLSVFDNQINNIPEMGLSFNADFLKGMCKCDYGFLHLLDVERMFSSQELNVIDCGSVV